MKKILLSITLITGVLATYGQDDESLLSRADSLYKLAEYAQSAKTYEAWLTSTKQKVDEHTCYKAAVSFSKSQDPEKAIHWLQAAVDKGMDDDYLTEIRFDVNFFPIHHTRAWKQFFQTHTAQLEKEAQTISHPHYRQELLELWRSDQYYRQLIFGQFNGRPPNELGRATEAVDRFNAVRVEQIMDEIGWPTHSKVGRDGAHAAWNIIQHAVFNPLLMKRSLEEMKKELANKEVDGVDYAYLYDRFQAVCYLGKQDYGIVRRVPIREEYLLEQRRKEIGFRLTMGEYLGSYTPLTKVACEKREMALQERYTTNLAQGKALLEQGNYEAAAKFYSKLMSCNGYIQTEDIYNYAKIKSLQNTPRSRFQAIRYIRSLAARGYKDVDQLQSDPTFDNIRDDKGYMEIIDIIKKYTVK